MWLEESPQTAVVHNIMRVLRSVRNFGNLAYVSIPITSGKLLYEVMASNPHMEREEVLEQVMDENYHVGFSYVEAVRARRRCPVLFPADMVPAHQEWEQDHFQALWLSIIAEMCTEVHMSKGWEFSNGGVEEFVHVVQLKLGIPRHSHLVFYNTKEDETQARERMKNIALYDHNNQPLLVGRGVELIETALESISARGFTASRLENSLSLLQDTKRLLDEGFYQ